MKQKTKKKKIYAYVFSFLMIASLFTGFLNLNTKKSVYVSFILDYGNGNNYGPYKKWIAGDNVLDIIKSFISSYSYNENITCIYNVCNTNSSIWKIYVNNLPANISSKIKENDIIRLSFENIT